MKRTKRVLLAEEPGVWVVWALADRMKLLPDSTQNASQKGGRVNTLEQLNAAGVSKFPLQPVFDTLPV